jgi:alpha-L-rhamnosidase
MLGHAETWLYAGLAGIRVDLSRDDASRISIASASAQYRSALGLIGSEWKRSEGQLQLKVTIPAGALAQVTLLAENATRIEENGRPAEKALGVLKVEHRGRHVAMTLGSGQYSFTLPLTQ